MTLALPSGPAPAPRRQLLVGSALAGSPAPLIGGMLAVWLLERQHAVDAGERFPMNYIIPEVATNVMLITLFGLCFFAQWAVYQPAGKTVGTPDLLCQLSLFSVWPSSTLKRLSTAKWKSRLPTESTAPVLRPHRHDDGDRDCGAHLYCGRSLPHAWRSRLAVRDCLGECFVLVLRRCGLCSGVVCRLRHEVRSEI